MNEPKPATNSALTLSRIFPVSRLKVFSAWTNPDYLQQWFKPFGVQIKVGQFDLRVGGAFRFDYQLPGQPPAAVTGTYLEIVEPEKLSFSWSSPLTEDKVTLVTILFEERENGDTEMTLTHSRFPFEEVARQHLAGWQSALEGLAKVLV
jgi:glutathione S-transferase